MIENGFVYSTPYNTGVITISRKSGMVNLNYNSTTNYKFVQNDEVLSFVSGILSTLAIKPRSNYDDGGYILKEVTGGEFRLSANAIVCTKSMESIGPLNLNYTYISDNF